MVHTGIIGNMDNSWINKALGGMNFANILNPQDDNKLLDEEVVMLLQGKNSFGDDVYSYLKITIRNLKRLKQFLNDGKQFMPSDFGTVVAAGRGIPTPETRQEMAITYQMVDVPQPKPAAPRGGTAAPRFWDEED